jgi:hypothetical protein
MRPFASDIWDTTEGIDSWLFVQTVLHPFWSALRSMRVIPGTVARLNSVACGP